MSAWVDLPPVIAAIDSGHVRVEFYTTGNDGTPELSWRCVMPRSVFMTGLSAAQTVEEALRKGDAASYIASLPNAEKRLIA